MQQPKIVRRSFGLALLALAALHARVPAAPTNETHGVDTAILDRTVKPDTDFYRFANGKWLDSAAIPADKPGIDAFTEVALRNESVLKRIVEKAASDVSRLPTDSEVHKIGEFYRIGMDEELADRLGVTPLEPLFTRIQGISNPNQVLPEIARLQRIGIGVGFGMEVEADFKDSRRKILVLAQGGLGLPDRDYYLKDDPQSKVLRERYHAYIGKLLELAGAAPNTATKDAADILDVETQLAKASRTRVQLRDMNALYHRMDLKTLQKQTPDLPWSAYFQEVGLAHPGAINVATPEFFQALNGMLRTTPLAQWKSYLRWQTLQSCAPYLSRPFAQEGFRFAASLTGQKEQPPRWRRVLETTQGTFGDAIGKLYVAEAFPPQARQRALALVLNLKAALHERLQNLDWMGPETRAEALKKLDAMQIKVGYPDRWKDYAGLRVSADSYAQNVMQANAFAIQRELKKAGKPVDRSEWAMTPSTVNAYYNPLNNEIVFPAGILQPPFFDADADDASNYGAIGMVIGHEMTHGFDDQGRGFDATGNLRDWWTPEDTTRFKARAQALVRQYSDYAVLGDVKVNGELTQGENIADLGGLNVAYQAWKNTWKNGPRPESIAGLTPEQRFFLAFAQIWRFKSAPEYARLLAQLDTHSPARWRVQGTLVNIPAFVEAFGAGDAQSKVRPGSGSVRIW